MWPPRISRNMSSSSGKDFSTRNGELLLRKQISFSQGRSNPIRTFTLSELQEVTNNFEQRGLGLHGGFSMHYLGILDDRKVVVKYFGGNPGDDFEDQLAEGLVTEIVVLSNIRHMNVVKFVGCCLETQVPSLVYEFVPRRDLSYNLERWRSECPPWSTRLKIALDAADALNYLHSQTSGPVVHRNMQPKSILIDEDYTAKLCGFSQSVPIPSNKTQAEDKIVFGAYPYIEPGYLTTGVVTEKVDVYPFGLILIELLTGERFPRYLFREGRDAILGVIGQREDLQPRPVVNDVESAILGEAMTEQQLDLEEACLAILVADATALQDAEGRTDQYRAFAKLALRCARPRTQERPTMKVVVEELRRISSVGGVPCT